MGEKEVMVLDADDTQAENLADLLAGHHYRSKTLNSFNELETQKQEHPCRALILNLDSVTSTNKILRNLKKKNPMLTIIALSGRRFHPELEEAMRDHISVCLLKPLDSDELFYWLKSIFENNDRPGSHSGSI